jgi:hypothetical protein
LSHTSITSASDTFQAQVLEAALQYAARGWRVFPCHSVREGRCTCGRGDCEDAGKHPRIKAWQKQASVDKGVVEGWFHRWPLSNVGIATGGGLVVIDLDGAEQVERLREIARERGGLPRTLVAKTGRGFHLYFKGLVERSKVIDGILVRGGGGYVIAPPSLHRAGVAYVWANNEVVADLPSWAIDWVEGGGAGTTPTVLLGERLPAYIANNGGGLERKVDVAIGALREPWSAGIEARVTEALGALSADCKRDDWLKVGMALHDCAWDDGQEDRGYRIWAEWSATGREKFKGEHDLETRWRSFGKRAGSGVTLGSLFHLAREAGWQEGAQAAAVPPRMNGHTVEFGPIRSPIVFPDVDQHGTPKKTCRNARAAIRHIGLECRHDTFCDRMSIAGQSLEQWAGELSDNTVHMLRDLMDKEYGLDCGSQHTLDAAVQECLSHQFDPVQNYLTDAQAAYDGVPRLKTWLAMYLGAEATPLNEAFGALALIAAVRRARQPGAKFDEIIVLIGPEGQGKSEAIELLAGPEHFSDQEILTLDERRQQEALEGVWLYEIGELAGMSRADVDKVKSFASRRVDRCRPAYGRKRVDVPRRCIFIATTNHSLFLKSQTGDRRFWPVETGRIDKDALARDRDQLWGEAAVLEARGVSIRLPEGLWSAAGEVQAARQEHDPWLDALSTVKGKAETLNKQTYHNPRTFEPEMRISTSEVFSQVQLPTDRWTAVTAKRVAFVMRKLGWDGPRPMKIDGALVRGFTRKPESP